MISNRVSTFTSTTLTPSTAATTAATNGLVPSYVRSVPVCPSGGTYTEGDQNTLPTCSIGSMVYNGTSYMHVLS